MGKIRSFVYIVLCLVIGYAIQEETMDILYPNRPKGIINNWFYNLEELK